jgi:hypothetical protein
MRIHWVRVLIGGFLIEVVLAVVLLGGFAAAGVNIADGVSTSSALIIGVGCFVVAFLVVLWLDRGIQNHLVLHGFLMGLAATLLYLGLVAGAGQLSSALTAYGPATFVSVNALRVVGAVLGGVACERGRAARRVGTPANVEAARN